MTRLIGPGKTRQLVYTGEPIPADEAADCGLVDKVVPPGSLDDTVDAWARSIASAGPQAIRLQKALVRRWDDIPLDHGIQAGMRSFTQAFATDEPPPADAAVPRPQARVSGRPHAAAGLARTLRGAGRREGIALERGVSPHRTDDAVHQTTVLAVVPRAGVALVVEDDAGPELVPPARGSRSR